MAEIQFETKLIDINGWHIIHLPREASAQLPSRGMTMIQGVLNGIPFKAVLEPDGKYMPGVGSSHWFRPDQKLLQAANTGVGDTVTLSIEPTKEWIDPDIPSDIQNALQSSPKAFALWNDITPMARWDWVRWVRAVKTEETRQKHLEVMLDKLNKGMRRPCCFNRSLCSEPAVSHNWQLIIPTQ